MKRITVMICMLAMMISLGACSSSSSAADVPQNNVSDNFGESLTGDSVPEKDVSQGLGDMDYYDASSLSFDDFDFYEDIIYGGVPEGANFPSLKYAVGDWKYNLRIRYDSSDGYQFDEIGYAELALDYDKETVIITLHPRMATDGFDAWTESDEEVGYEPFEGGFDENDVLRLIGNDCVIAPDYYYDYEGREYFIGTIWFSEESFGDFIMFRGQN